MFRGTFAALVTPFRDGGIDFTALERLVEHVINGGASGLVPCGTTGESPTLTDAEQKRIIETVVRVAAGRVPIIAGTGSNCTDKTLAASQVAIDAGADAVMLVAPYYNKPSQRGLFAHFGYVAARIDRPIVLYNIPGRCGVEIAHDTILRLREEHPNIVAVKHATGSIDGAAALKAACDITILSGDDTLTLPLMSVGAEGVISVIANLLPAEMSGMTDAALAGNWDGARRFHENIFPLAKALMSLDTNPIPIKTALAMRGMMDESFRLPMCTMDDAARRKLETALADWKPLKSKRQLSTESRRVRPA